MKNRLLGILIAAVMICTAMPAVAFAQTFTVHNSCYNQLSMSGGSGKIHWSSSNKKIATVSKKGKVKGIKAGTCTITARRSNAKASCKMKVLAYYNGYNKIPDFGATVGKCTSNTYIQDGVNVAVYKAKNVKTAKSWIKTYKKKLKKWHFRAEDGAWIRGDEDEGYVVYITRDGKTIIIGYASVDELV